MKRASLAALIGMLAAACGSRSVSYQVQIIGVACTSDPSTSPFPSTGTITLTVTGDGIAKPLTASYDLGAGAGQINSIPAGTNRVISIAVTATPSNQLTSVGQSLPFNVPDAVPSPNVPIPVTVFARRVSVFTQTNLATAPTTCSMMMSPRAGHTATLLQDGRVFIAGGFVLDGGSLGDGGEAIALASTEIYDPTTGAFTAGGTMQVPDGNGHAGNDLPRAFHSATLMPSGLVLLAGGEWYRDGATLPLQGALVFGPSQPPTQAFGGIEMNAPRTRLAAAVDASGRVIVFGGYGAGGNVNDTVEWWDPNDPATWTGPFYKANIMSTGGGPFSLPLVGMSVAPVAGGNQIAVLGGLAGGLDGGAQQVSGAITYFSYDGGTFRATQAANPLPQPTSSAAVAPFIDASRVILAGGYDGTASGFLQVVTSSGSVTQQQTTLAAARGDLCAAALADGRVLTAGGRTFDTGTATSLGTVELIANNSGKATVIPQQALPTPRSNHTCTTLKDGSVLILGGMNEQSGQQTVLQDALIYMPQPTPTPPS